MVFVGSKPRIQSNLKSFLADWHEIWNISWFWSDKGHTCAPIITSLVATEVWAGGIFLGNWNRERLCISYFLRTASITENRQGMTWDLIAFLVLVHQRTYLCPHHYEFRNHRGVGGCGIFLFNWNLERLSIPHFLRTASITENRHPSKTQPCYKVYMFFLIYTRTVWNQVFMFTGPTSFRFWPLPSTFYGSTQLSDDITENQPRPVTPQARPDRATKFICSF